MVQYLQTLEAYKICWVLILGNNHLGDIEMVGLNFLTTLTICIKPVLLQIDSNNFGRTCYLTPSKPSHHRWRPYLWKYINYSGNFVSLTWLDLVSNLLPSYILTPLVNYRNFHVLDLSNNSRGILATVSDLSQLNGRGKAFIELSEHISVNMKNCHHLSLLDLQANTLVGVIPKKSLNIWTCWGSIFTCLCRAIHNQSNSVWRGDPEKIPMQSFFCFNKLYGQLSNTSGEHM